MQPTPGATPAPSSQGLTLADIAQQATDSFGWSGDGHFWWHDLARRSYVVCPPRAVDPMGLAVVDDFGTLVTVPSTGAHEGYAGVPA